MPVFGLRERIRGFTWVWTGNRYRDVTHVGRFFSAVLIQNEYGLGASFVSNLRDNSGNDDFYLGEQVDSTDSRVSRRWVSLAIRLAASHQRSNVNSVPSLLPGPCSRHKISDRNTNFSHKRYVNGPYPV